MNQSESIAYDWLQRQGYRTEDIIYQSRKTPTFVIVSDGRGYEVKRLIKRKGRVSSVW